MSEWTELVGLRRAVIALVVRSLVAAPIIGGLAWLIAPLINYVPFSWWTLGGLGVAMVIPGITLGYWMGRRLDEIAGMASWLISLLAIIAIAGVSWSGVWAATLDRPMPDWAGSLTLALTIFASLPVLKLRAES